MWVRFDDTFGDDPRVMSAGVAGAGVLLLGLCFSNRTLGDGWVPAAVIRRLFDGSRAEAEVETIARLLQLGLLQEVERNRIAGYQIHQDFVKLQPTRADVERRRGDLHLQKSKAGRLGGVESGKARRKQNRSRHLAQAQQTGSASEPPIPIPNPIPNEQSTDAFASGSPLRERELVEHAFVCKLYSSIVEDEPNSGLADRTERLKEEMARLHVTCEPDTLHRAVDAVDKLVELRGSKGRSERPGGFVQLGRTK